MSAIGLTPARGASRYRVISTRADFRRDDYYFPRTQSIAMRDLPWERRLNPIRPWNHVAVLAAAAVTIGALAVNVL